MNIIENLYKFKCRKAWWFILAEDKRIVIIFENNLFINLKCDNVLYYEKMLWQRCCKLMKRNTIWLV